MEIFILLSMIVLNGLFVMSEIALVSARKSRLETLADKGDSKAKLALELSENPERFLSTVQIGITLILIMTGKYSGEKFGKDLIPFFERFDMTRPYAETIATSVILFIVTFVSILIGELIPKKLGLIRAEKIARAIARPMRIVTLSLHPIVVLLSTITNLIFRLFNIKKVSDSSVTEEEIKALITEGSEMGAIDEEEKEIIERVFHLGDRNITSLMTHRTDILWVDEKDTVAGVKEKFREIVFSTFPVCEGSVDNVKGLVHVKDMLSVSPETPISKLTKPALFVPENNTAYQLLEKFKGTKIHACFIVNEYGTLEGMITINDILEAIVGEVPQAGQEEYEIIKRKDGSYLVEAQIHFYDFLSYFEKGDWINDDELEFDTLAGFALHHLEHIPVTGEIFAWRCFDFEIIDMDGQRIDKILVKISEELKEELGEKSE